MSPDPVPLASARARTDGAPIGPLPCQHLDGRWWFSERPAELEVAKAHCRRCPMQAPCLIGAVARREACGVWGGQIFESGSIIEHKRPRGRPPQAARQPRADLRLPGEPTVPDPGPPTG